MNDHDPVGPMSRALNDLYDTARQALGRDTYVSASVSWSDDDGGLQTITRTNVAPTDEAQS